MAATMVAVQDIQLIQGKSQGLLRKYCTDDQLGEILQLRMHEMCGGAFLAIKFYGKDGFFFFFLMRR